MSLNIKNQITYELVKQLASLKGTSLTSAVTEAVQNELEKSILEMKTRPTPMKRSERLQAFAREYSSRVKRPIHSWEIDGMLYGEDGLPK
jgi:hypothetical protein